MNTNVSQTRVCLVQDQQEECKTCQNECSCLQKKQYDVYGTNLDEISSTEDNNEVKTDQFIRNQSETVVKQTSEVAFAHNNMPKEILFVQNSDIHSHESILQPKRSDNNTAVFEPYDCQMKENVSNIQADDGSFDLDEVVDPNIFLKRNLSLNLDQISSKQSEVSNRKHSVGFQRISISENVEGLSPKVDIQLQKRHHDTKNTELLKQNVKKALQTQKKQIKGSKLNEENKKEHIMQASKTIRYSSRKPLNAIDKAYFDNYGHKAIHDEMLNDKIRCEAYKSAIATSVKGKTVLDVGAGTGFLSVIAAKADALHVYAVEFSGIADFAEQFINDNGCKEKITLIKKRMEDVNEVDIPKIDVIISEWMGYFLLFENMLPSVLDARKRFLKGDGIMLPCEGRIYIAGVEWIGTEINGVVVQPDKNTLDEAQIMFCNQDKVISNQCIVSDFSLQDCSNPLDDFGCQSFTLELTKDAKVNAFVGWFDVALTGEIALSTAPSQPRTHWKQVMFFLKKEIQAKVGEQIDGTFKISANSHNHRSLGIDLAYRLSSQKTFLKQHFVLEQ